MMMGFSIPFSAKEIQLMHRAPVVGLVVLDGRGAPLPEPLEVAHDLSRSPDMQGSHQLLVISEEQLKVRKGLIIFAYKKMIVDAHFFAIKIICFGRGADNLHAFNVLRCFCVKSFFISQSRKSIM